MSSGLFIEPIPSEQESLVYITEAEQLAAASFGAARRREYFAWRALVRRELGDVTITYNEAGAPVLPDHPEIHISVSHGAGRIAVCISDRPCAVDIESFDRNFSRIAARFLTPDEAALCSDVHYSAAIWCAKESLYKLSGMSELDLLEDLRITAVGAEWIEGSIKKGEPLRLSLRYLDDAVVVWRL